MKKFDIDLLQFGITNICNNNCIMCHQSQEWYKAGNTGFMSFEHAKKIIDDIYRNDIKFKVVHTFWKGEPFLAPDFPDILEYLFRKNNEKLLFEKLYINTNGTVLKGKEERLLDILNLSDEIRTTLNFSIDASTDETYRNIRRSSFFPDIEKSLKKIIRLRSERKLKDPVIIMQIVIMKENFHEVDDFVSKWQSELSGYGIKADYMYYLKSIEKDTIFFRPLQPETEESRNMWMSVIEKYIPEEYRKINDIHIKRIHANKQTRPDKPCYHLWTTPVIGWDGKVTACCSDFYIELLGDTGIDFRNDDFSRIWYGPEMEELRRKSYFLEYEDMPEVCRNCIMYLELTEEFKMLLTDWAIERGYPVLYSSDPEFCNDPEDLINIAHRLMKEGDFDKVYPIICRAMNIDRNNEKVHRAFLTYYSKTGQYKLGLDIVLRLIDERKDYRYYDEAGFFYENLEKYHLAFDFYRKAFRIKKEDYFLVKMIEMLHKNGSREKIRYYIRLFTIGGLRLNSDIAERMIDLYFIHPYLKNTDIYSDFYKKMLFLVNRDDIELSTDFILKLFYLKRDLGIKGELPYWREFLESNLEKLGNIRIMELTEFEINNKEQNRDYILYILKNLLEDNAEFIMGIYSHTSITSVDVWEIIKNRIDNDNRKTVLDFLIKNRMYLEWLKVQLT